MMKGIGLIEKLEMACFKLITKAVPCSQITRSGLRDARDVVTACCGALLEKTREDSESGPRRHP